MGIHSHVTPEDREKRNKRIEKLIREGLSTGQVASRMGLQRPRITEILRERGWQREGHEWFKVEERHE